MSLDVKLLLYYIVKLEFRINFKKKQNQIPWSELQTISLENKMIIGDIEEKFKESKI